MNDYSTADQNAGGVTFSELHGSTFADVDGDSIPTSLSASIVGRIAILRRSKGGNGRSITAVGSRRPSARSMLSIRSRIFAAGIFQCRRWSPKGPKFGPFLLRISRSTAFWWVPRKNEAVAYSQKCTHLSCAVYYSAGEQKLVCPCHRGYFSIEDGSVLQGPPPRPLPRIVLENRMEALVAVGVEGEQ
jgi:Rieske Fe-S protein